MNRRIVVHRITMGDVDDPDLFVASPIHDWQQTEKGKWIMKHSNPTPIWQRHIDHLSFGHVYTISAYLTDKQLTEYYLRFE
jgi:hypothetical protein